MDSSQRFRVVFVLGIAHGGSTLLGRMLNRHPAVVSPGELLRLSEALEKDLPCYCGSGIRECDTWRQRLQRIPENAKRDFRKWTPDSLAELAARENGKILVDLSKTRAYRLAKRWTESDVGFILVVRDPRGAMRGYGAMEADLTKKIRVHKKWTKRFEKFETKVGPRCLKVYYEDLVRQPEATLKEISAHLGVPFCDAMLRPGDGAHHFVHSSRSSYRKGENKLTLDERWRDELSQAQQAAIEQALSGFATYRDRYFR